MAEYHVGCGLAGIYAGTLNKQGTEWLTKSEVTEEAQQAVIMYEKDRLKSKKLLKETIEYTFRNGDVLTVTYALKKEQGAADE